MKWEATEERNDLFELVASWRVQTAPDRYKITCRQLPLGDKAPIENEIEFDEPTTTKNEEGRTEAKVLLAPAKPLRCELTAIIGNDVSAPSNPAIVPPGPRRGVIPAPTTTVPTSATPTTAPATTQPRPGVTTPVVTTPKPGNRPQPAPTTTAAPAPGTTTTVAPPATPSPTTTAPVASTSTTSTVADTPTTTAAAATQPAPTPRPVPGSPSKSPNKKG